MPRRIKLTALERNRLVQILRCAVDLIGTEADPAPGSAIVRAIIHLGFDPENPVYSLAWLARDATGIPFSAGMHITDWNVLRLLEAAARIEEGHWP